MMALSIVMNKEVWFFFYVCLIRAVGAALLPEWRVTTWAELN